MVGLPWKNLPSMQANLDGCHTITSMHRQQVVVSSKYCSSALYAVESKSSIAYWLEENNIHGKGLKVSKGANKQWRKGKRDQTSAEAPRGFRSKTWSIPFLSFVTWTAALWSLSAPEWFILQTEQGHQWKK